MLELSDFDFTYDEAKDEVRNVFKKFIKLRLIADDEESLYTGQQFDNEIVDTSRVNTYENTLLRNADKSYMLHRFNKEIRKQINKLNKEEIQIINLKYYNFFKDEQSRMTDEEIAEEMDCTDRTIRDKKKLAIMSLALAFKNSDRLNRLIKEIE